MTGSQLTIYATDQRQRIRHMSIVEWILDEARRVGIQGATVVEVAESVDAKGKYHAARFFELAEQSVAVTIIAADAYIDALLAKLDDGGVRLFYTRAPVEYNALGTDGAS
ncbi:PII-like signaling protein [Paraburkholderia sp. RAU2J]|uniref:DUF190 domain-containing protein n=1 Tax=Paraburkholderia sp. RAU2J TaxID=1938810 RepID=UPI000EAF9F77|nr:DUF190 domain-containing protein [Paraburkholderia sp. RAU2J]RKT13750.1 PII-like signaling protein [Paraburkholderia sp. RAU2J]